MGLEKVKEEVLSKAKQEAEKLLADAQSEAKRIKKEREKQLDSLRKDAEARLASQREEATAKAVSSAELEAKKEMLNARKEIIREVFDNVKESLRALPTSTRKVHIAKLLEMAGKELDIAKVYCAEADLKNISGYPSEKADILGGIIAENKEGTIKVDLSYDTLLEEVYKDSLKEVSEALFKK
jgi:V/A-type H+/Na+-transporting ATPase subunit E